MSDLALSDETLAKKVADNKEKMRWKGVFLPLNP